ncbi:MAG: hypothetical protein KGJ00_21040, partial [Bradyrhizobium sp.]|nr:hypothetical protein [Bradyrhizobium sp.]
DFPAALSNRFTLGFRQPITIAATAPRGEFASCCQYRCRQQKPPRRVLHQPNGCSGGEDQEFLKKCRAYSLPAWNEGVGEHVRTRSHSGSSGKLSRGTGEIANHLRSAPNEENQFLLLDPFGGANSLKLAVQPFDLMSRRHPLSSTRATLQIRSRE